MKEIWKDIDGFEGLYQVSNTGKVKSLPRKSMVLTPGNGPGTNKTVSEKILGGIPYTNNNIMMVLVKPDAKTKHKFVRKLLSHIVAEAFIPNPDGLKYVKHIDGNLGNNHVDNLEWSSRGDLDMYRKLKRPVICVTDGTEYDSVKGCAEEIGVDRVLLTYYLKSGKPFRNKIYAYLEDFDHEM